MHKIEIPEAKFKMYIPEDLSECNKEQYINICGLAYQLNNGNIDKETFQIQAVKFLALSKKERVNLKSEVKKYANIYNIATVLDSFFEEDEQGNTIIKQYYIHNPIEEIRGTFHYYYGPSDEFNNVTYGEYVDALSYLYDYLETQDIDYLYLLFATFYREKRVFKPKFSKDKRVPYNQDKVELLAKKFKKQHFGIIYGFFLLFTSFNKYLQNAKIFVQGKEIDLSILYKDFPSDVKQKESNIQGIGMKSLLYTIAESGVFGTLEDVRKAPLWEILIRLYDIRKRDFDALANQPKQEQHA